MKQGVLLFAFNNETIDYVAMAAWSAQRIQRHLGLPVSIVTDQAVTGPFDQTIIVKKQDPSQRWFADQTQVVAWHNTNRMQASELTPYDQTLVLDVDYVVASNQLLELFKSEQDFLSIKTAYDVTGLTDYSSLNSFGRYQMPMNWATVMYFRCSKLANMVFGMMSMIKNNWQHYRRLFGTGRSTYRNDHALSIALSTVHGHTIDYPNILWSMASVDPHHRLTQVDVDKFRVDFITPDKKVKYVTLNQQDFHAMGKNSLGAIVANNC